MQGVCEPGDGYRARADPTTKAARCIRAAELSADDRMYGNLERPVRRDTQSRQGGDQGPECRVRDELRRGEGRVRIDASEADRSLHDVDNPFPVGEVRSHQEVPGNSGPDLGHARRPVERNGPAVRA
jgi:hypothetical protein